MPVCPHCNEEKTADEFGWSNSGRKPCVTCSECRPRLTKQEKDKYMVAPWRKVNPEKARANSYRSSISALYGISEEQYNQALLAQGDKCAICGESQIGKRLHVDHCHVSGTVRELLCRSCNYGLGNFRDDVDLLDRAIKYLKKHKKLDDQ